ncbi:glycosyltransferase family 2 protein [Microcella sp.]|uniref:glycosyltransferase family 2 protein n=1 Tax=Microcella sp. TaxID=1913979 RepID=UPI00299F5DE8|nr:glycosyltransferase family 2 protein [Microcella sp.]MDX2025776.1 glycosyltransferase family 2 protein [Microcella sp.]
MQPRVIAIVVARRGGEPLQQTLDALAQQSRRPDALVVVDAAGADAVTAQLAAANPTQFVTAGSGLGFGELVHRGLAAVPLPAPTSSPYGGVDEWLWLLRHDTVPDPHALQRLLAAVEIAPSVAVAGAKQLEAEHPTVIAAYGETLTRWGATIAIAERELDQAQHDRTSDVLAVGEAAMLVRRAVFTAVEGFDPALPSVDAALDLCVRIRLAGHRVVGVPQARVFVYEGTATAGRAGGGKPVSARVRARLMRAAQVHRRLSYAPAIAVPIHWLSLGPIAMVRALGHLVRKRPTYVAGEFAAALTVAFSGGAVPAARRRLARGRTLGWSAIAPLRMPADEVRRRRAIARDAQLAALDDDRPPRPDFLPSGGGVVALAAAVGALAWAPLMGAPALLGGALAPLAPDVSALLAGLERSAVGAADPFSFVLALLGLLTPWQPSLAIVVLMIAALPLAALGGWWAAAAIIRRPGPVAVAALLWAFSPALISALVDGRPAAVVAHVALPVLVASAARAPRSWSATGIAGLAAAIVVASSPSLLPALLVMWVVWMLANPRRLGRLLTLPVPTVALLAPLVYDQVRRGTPFGLLADPGLPAAPAAVTPTGLVLGWPDLSRVLAPLGHAFPDLPAAVIVGVLGGLACVLVALSLVGLALPHGRRAILPLVGVAVGLVTAWGVSGVSVSVWGGQPVSIDVGPALSLAGLGLALAATRGLDAVHALAPAAQGGAAAGPGRRGAGALARALALVVVVGAAAAATPALSTLLSGTAAVSAGDARTLPAIVAAEAQADPAIGTIVLTPVESGLAARIDRGAGLFLAEQRTIAHTSALSGTVSPQSAALADLVANIAADSGRDVSAALDELDVRFVLLQSSGPGAPALAAEGITAALDGNPVLAPIGDADAGRLWRVVPTDDTRSAPVAAPTGSSLVLAVQLGIVGLTLLLAVPTTLRPRRRHDDAAGDDGPAATFEVGDDDE